MKLADESVLHFVWKFRLFPQFGLRTVDDKPVEIIHPGIHNTNSGPDFTDARIKIDGQLWAGNVELHIRTSDWFRHRHQNDPAYRSVILHVVYETDSKSLSDSEPPVIELKKYINSTVLKNAEHLLSSQSEIPCHNLLSSVSDEAKSAMVSRVAVERMELKIIEKAKLLESLQADFYRLLWIEISSAFGLKANVLPMYLLALHAPLHKILQSANDRNTVEAFLFGMASLLPTKPNDEYSQALLDEFNYLKHKYGLDVVIESHVWKFHRIKPVGFPTIRISQLASLLLRWDELIDSVFKRPNLQNLQAILRVEASGYWNSHYRFGVSSESNFVKRVGDDLINRILINAIIPVMMSFSKNSDNPIFHQIAIDWLEQLPAENNAIVRKMKSYGFKNTNALMSQGLIQLKNAYCSEKKCLFCSIGYKIIKS